MNTAASIARPASTPTPRGLRGAVAAALGRLTGRVVAATFAISMALDAWFVFDFAAEDIPQVPPIEGYLSGAIVNLTMAFVVMLATLVADEAVARGARRLPAYAVAVVTGCALATLAQAAIHHALGLRSRYGLPELPPDVAALQPVALYFEYLIWSSIIVSIYVNRRTALQAAARMNAAHVERVRAQRSALGSRLQALQARVEPQFLLDALACVRDLYERDPDKAGTVLGDLIDYLRAALPHLRESTSTLGQELRLAASYLGVVRAQRGGEVALRVDATPSALAAPMPAMIVLPLIERVARPPIVAEALPHVVEVAARVDDGRLRVEIAARGIDGHRDARGLDTLLRDLRERLHGLHGADGGLATCTAAERALRIVLEIPT